jgi:hypothetical protein
MHPGSLLVRTAFITLIFAARAAAQSEAAPELAGPLRDIARTEIVNAAAFDPRAALAITPTPQAVLELRGKEAFATFHAGLQTGDNSYNVFFSVPINHSADTRLRDRGNIPYTAGGFDFTNLIWRPKAKPALTRQIAEGGLLTSPSGRPLATAVQGTAATALSRESQVAVARAIDTTDAVSVPWAFFFNTGYKFSKDRFDFTDASSSKSTSESHITDVLHILFGLQFHARPRDPGYFVAFSYIYSSFFQESEQKIGPPSRLFGTLTRVEMRHAFPDLHIGVNPSFTYELDTHLKTIEGTVYTWLPAGGERRVRNVTRLNVGARIGYEQGRGGAFATVFVGPTLGARF